VPEAGQKFAFPLALKRSLVVWLRGLGLALPIISLITLIVAYNTLKNDGQTSWDRDFNISVLHRDLSIFRWLLVAVVWLSVLSVYAIILAASKS